MVDSVSNSLLCLQLISINTGVTAKFRLLPTSTEPADGIESAYTAAACNWVVVTYAHIAVADMQRVMVPRVIFWGCMRHTLYVKKCHTFNKIHRVGHVWQQMAIVWVWRGNGCTLATCGCRGYNVDVDGGDGAAAR